MAKKSSIYDVKVARERAIWSNRWNPCAVTYERGRDGRIKSDLEASAGECAGRGEGVEVIGGTQDSNRAGVYTYTRIAA